MAQLPMPRPQASLWKMAMRKFALRSTGSISFSTLSPMMFPAGSRIKKS